MFVFANVWIVRGGVTKLVIFCRLHKCMTPNVVYFNRPYDFTHLKDCIPQTLLGPFLNTVFHMNLRNMVMYWFKCKWSLPSWNDNIFSIILRSSSGLLDLWLKRASVPKLSRIRTLHLKKNCWSMKNKMFEGV